MSEDLPFKVIRGAEEVMARGANLRVARGAFDAAVREYPQHKLELRNTGHVAARNWIIKTVRVTLTGSEGGALLTDHMGKAVGE